MINKVSSIREDELTYILTYAGYILLSFELTKTMIVGPIKSFYANTEFQGGPFKTYKEDVLARHKNEFEACLLYLKDFMKAIDSNDLLTIQALRKHRNDLAHNLPDKLSLEEIRNGSTPLENVKNVIFKLSNYRTYMEVGQEPELRCVDWGLVKGEEYLLFEMVINKVRTLK